MKPVFHYLLVLSLSLFTFTAFCQSGEADSLAADGYMHIADSLMDINELDSAIKYYDKASFYYHKLNDWENINQCALWQTYLLIDLSAYDEAIAKMDSTIAFMDAHLGPGNIYSFHCAIKKSVVYYVRYDFAKSKKNLENAIRLFSNNPARETPSGARMLATAYFEYGNIYLQTGVLDSGSIMYKKTLAIREKQYPPNDPLISDCYNNLGIVYIYYSDYEMASAYMEKALRSREKHYGFADPQTAWSYTNIGLINISAKKFDKALDYCLKGLEARKQSLPEGHIDFASSYSAIANVYNDMGDHDKALEYYYKALDIYIDKLGEDNLNTAGIYNNIANSYDEKKNYKEALIYFKKALHIAEKAAEEISTPSLARYEHNTADMYFNMANIDSALYFNTRSLHTNYEIALKNNDVNDILDFEIAFSAFEQKAAIYTKLYRMTNNPENLHTAMNAYLKYLELLDFLRIKAPDMDSKLFLARTNNDVMNGVINTSYLLHTIDSLYNAKQTGQLIENSKSNILQEMLLKTRTNPDNILPDSLIEKLDHLSGAIIALKTQQYLNDNDTINFEDALFALQKQLGILNEQIMEQYPDINEQIIRSELLPVPNDPEEAILNYYVSDSMLYIYYSDDHQNRIKAVPIDSTLEQSVNTYLKCIKKNRIHAFDALSTRLYQILIQPVDEWVRNKKKLVIIPDKFLYYLPFETLCSQKDPSGFTNKPYLIRDFDIIYHFSAVIYFNSLKERHNPPRIFAGYAPVFDSKDNPVSVPDSSLVTFRDTTNMLSMELLRSITLDGKTYNSLPYSKMEIDTIAGMFEHKALIADTYQYEQSSEESFRKQCNKYSIIHLASHGFINEHNPSLSGIVFYPDEQHTDNKVFNNDGILYTGEIYDLDLNANLIVLSACETGLGKIANGEGLLSMTRAFIYSGSQNVLFSLWKVDDRSTYKLMVRFYEDMLDGNTYSGALRKAKLRLISNEDTAFPKYWAGLNLIGNN